MSADSPTLRELAAGVVEALAQAHRTVDLSGDTRVQLGYATAPSGELPYVSVSPPELLVEGGRARRDLWDHSVRIRIRAWTYSTGEDLDARTTTAMSLADDLVGALEDATRDRDSILYVIDAMRLGATLDQAVDVMPIGIASVEILLELRYRRVAGQET